MDLDRFDGTEQTVWDCLFYALRTDEHPNNTKSRAFQWQIISFVWKWPCDCNGCENTIFCSSIMFAQGKRLMRVKRFHSPIFTSFFPSFSIFIEFLFNVLFYAPSFCLSTTECHSMYKTFSSDRTVGCKPYIDADIRTGSKWLWKSLFCCVSLRPENQLPLWHVFTLEYFFLTFHFFLLNIRNIYIRKMRTNKKNCSQLYFCNEFYFIIQRSMQFWSKYRFDAVNHLTIWHANQYLYSTLLT